MDIEMLTSVAQIVEAATVLGAAVFAGVQLAELKKQRHDAVASELMRSFLDGEFAAALAIIQDVPDASLAGDLRDAGADVRKAVVQVCTSFETMGLLVHRRIAPFDLVTELAGGVTVVMWRKLQPWLQQIRREQAQPSWAEWFQWLAEQCEKHKVESRPAYLLHAGWNP